MQTSNKLTILTIFTLAVCVVLFVPAPTVLASCNGSYSGSSGYQDYTGCDGNAIYWFNSCDQRLELYQQCGANQTCENAQCVNNACAGDDYTGCSGNAVYWFDSCDNRLELYQQCTSSQVCQDAQCKNIGCSTDSQCGADTTIGSPFCQGNNVYQNYKTYKCNNPGTSLSSCSNSTVARLQTTCTGNQTCSNGSCGSVNCSTNSQCGSSGSIGSFFCQGNNVYQNYKTYTCNNPGTTSSYCSDATSLQLQTICTGNQTCSNGSCGNTCTQNSQQRCIGNSMYWFDSCGVQGAYVGTCGQTNSNLTVTKMVKNITTNNVFTTSTYASPSDMLLFMITLRADSSDAQNVYVRDVLPINLTYNNQLTVACTTNNGSNGSCNNGYSGDIVSGLRLNTISAGQTVTITYQSQVAGANNFTFGTTTLNNIVTTTSSNVSSIPSAMASVIVTKAGVLGASTISTGLTNNFWVDSFLLPLLITLIVIWMWRSGMFFGIEKWLDSKKKTRRGYKAEKELLSRIEKISKIER